MIFVMTGAQTVSICKEAVVFSISIMVIKTIYINHFANICIIFRLHLLKLNFL